MRILSPKKKGARPRVLSDYGVDHADESDEAADDTRNLKGGESDDEEFDQLDETDFASTGPSSARSQTGPSKTPRASSGSIVELDGPPAGWTNKTERSPPVKQLDGAHVVSQWE